jgi:hypothetical protein
MRFCGFILLLATVMLSSEGCRRENSVAPNKTTDTTKTPLPPKLYTMFPLGIGKVFIFRYDEADYTGHGDSLIRTIKIISSHKINDHDTAWICRVTTRSLVPGREGDTTVTAGVITETGFGLHLLSADFAPLNFVPGYFAPILDDPFVLYRYSDTLKFVYSGSVHYGIENQDEWQMSMGVGLVYISHASWSPYGGKYWSGYDWVLLPS